MGKSVLEKCLTNKPQSEIKMWTSLSILAQPIACMSNPEKRVGKVNRPKSSVNRRGERIKTRFESGEGRNFSRRDRTRKSQASGRTARNCAEAIRTHNDK
jgi:hypothetical protein